MTARLISCDMDGTVVFDGRIGERDLEAMERWRAAGNILVANTGRSRSAFTQVAAPVGAVFDYMILYTGAVVTDSRLEVLEATTLPHGVVDDLLDHLDGQQGVTVFATTLEGDLLLYDTIGSGTAILNLYTPASREELQGRQLIGVPLRFTDQDLAARTLDHLERSWAERAVGFRNQDFIDVVPAGASKGGSLRSLLERLQGPQGPCAGDRIETFSIGDSWNDIPMHRATDHAYALPWAPPEVTQCCEGTVGSLEELVDRLL
ncbi:HAD-IIB family hydrolase [Actinomyces bowdenii]|uniref:HAD family phosphatase n=1 Tax=Actinomyces bowdenii TaxID=131109 RepID=A0A853EK22_9ACTO|nr:HAD-IIB family hydrolase [Actinomyces bowdenii]MBF0697524.1 HAD family phosphatase [Actinomyces bowdenii]NYS69697.1 HAD family phosphatase [Actinomyces bowdenii]